MGLGHAPPPKQYAHFSEFNKQILKGNNFFLIIYIEGDGRFLYCIAVREVNSTNCLPHKCKNLYYSFLLPCILINCQTSRSGNTFFAKTCTYRMYFFLFVILLILGSDYSNETFVFISKSFPNSYRYSSPFYPDFFPKTTFEN